MEHSEQSISSVQIGMTFGAITGGLMIGVPALLSFLPALAQAGELAVYMFGIYYAIRRYQRGFLEKINFLQAMKVGMLTVLFTSIIVAFYSYIMVTMDPSNLDAYTSLFETSLKSMNLPSEQASSMVDQLKQLMSPAFFALIMWLSNCFLGSILACICSILKITLK